MAGFGMLEDISLACRWLSWAHGSHELSSRLPGGGPLLSCLELGPVFHSRESSRWQVKKSFFFMPSSFGSDRRRGKKILSHTKSCNWIARSQTKWGSHTQTLSRSWAQRWTGIEKESRDGEDSCRRLAWGTAESYGCDHSTSPWTF